MNNMIALLKGLLIFIIAFIPFFLLVLADVKSNLTKEIRYKQFFMPFVASIYCLAIGIFMNKITALLEDLIRKLGDSIQGIGDKYEPVSGVCTSINDFIKNSFSETRIVFALVVVYNTAAIIVFLILKKIILLFFNNPKKEQNYVNRFAKGCAEIFYFYDIQDEKYYLRDEYVEGRKFFKVAMWGTTILSFLAILVSYFLCGKDLIKAPYYPVFAILIIGEIYFFVDGMTREEKKSTFSVAADDARHMANYMILRQKLKDLFGKKLTSEGTSCNNSADNNSSMDEMLLKFEKEYGFIGENYTKFIRNQVKNGLTPDLNYLSSGVELASGKNLLFNTPFYYKLSPYLFYAMSSFLQKHGNVLIVMGRRGTTNDIRKWCESGLFSVSHVPNLWEIFELTSKEVDEDEIYYDSRIGLITPEGVHDLEIHKKNLAFLKNVSFVVIIEPSKLVNTSQIGLNLLVENFKRGNKVVYCSLDRNCDGLLDSLSHILQTNISQVSATEYPQGVSSYMCWKTDNEYMQHILIPGISRYLGFGTELSFAALKNQVSSTIWYGGDSFPVIDMHWIARQYYHDLLHYAELEETQDSFDGYFETSYNYCDEKTNDDRFLTVEDEFNNLFEVRRDFATISRKQGFVNVISSEYLLREYMTDNDCIFTADAKAIPYITADFARTDRNIVLELCLRMCLADGVGKSQLITRLNTINANISIRKDADFENSDLLVDAFWKFLCDTFVCANESITNGKTPVLRLGNKYRFEKKIIVWKNEYSRDKGFSEDVYRINSDYIEQFTKALLDDLQRAKFIAERDNEDTPLGIELKGHLFQKYLPGQKFTIDGKLYQMETITVNNRVLMRRAAEHINGRNSYRQIRKYKLENISKNGVDVMGAYQNINGFKVIVQKADIFVDTIGYWELEQYNDFESGRKIILHSDDEQYGRFKRQHYNKELLCLDFSMFENFTDEIRINLTVILNEIFRTLFAENQHYIVAVTRGEFEKTLTYSLQDEGSIDKAIYIIEDSQLDIGLMVAVKRNIDRIMQMATDYLLWNHDNIVNSWPDEPENVDKNNGKAVLSEDGTQDEVEKEKHGFFGKIGAGIKKFFVKIGGFFKKIFKKKKKTATESVENPVDVEPQETPDDINDIERQIDGVDGEAAEPAEAIDGEAAEPAETIDGETAEPTEAIDGETAEPTEAIDGETVEEAEEIDDYPEETQEDSAQDKDVEEGDLDG